MPPPDPPKYALPTDPVNVLYNLVTAYVARDSIGTDSVYADGYLGQSIDPSLPTPLPLFSKTDEVRHVGRLRLDPNIVSVILDLGLPISWHVLDASASDPPGWKVIQITSQLVQIEDISQATTFESKDQTIEYVFEPTTTATGTTWKVVRWTEFVN